MVAVRSHLSSLPLEGALIEGRADDAMRAAAGALAEGEQPHRVIEGMLDCALVLCGREAAGASWSHALLSLGAVAGLLDRWGPDAVRPAVVGAAGFLAYARPTRSRSIPSGQRPWPGTPQWLDLIRAGELTEAVRAFRAAPSEAAGEAWTRGSLLTSAGWGHQAIVGGHFARLARRYPERAEALYEAAIRAWVPLEGEDAVIAEGPVRADLAVAISEGPEVAAAQAPAGGDALIAGVLAALELLRRTPDLRSVHGVTYAREVLMAGDVEEPEAARMLAFVGGGWERARRDRRLRGQRASLAVADLTGPEDAGGTWEETVSELCSTELRPGFGHNVKIAETCTELSRVLPARHAPLVLAALRATVTAWTRSRRPALFWREVSGRAVRV